MHPGGAIAIYYGTWCCTIRPPSAALADRRGNLRLFLAAFCFALGVAGFSGGLYARALGGLDVGPVVPIGGTLLLLGWFWLLAAAFGQRR